MDTTQIGTVVIGVTRARLTAMVTELQQALASTTGFDCTFYGSPNGRGPSNVRLRFTNDDMEADINPDLAVDLLIDFVA